MKAENPGIVMIEILSEPSDLGSFIPEKFLLMKLSRRPANM